MARVAAVFNDNGSGMRGDLRAVINAILLDAEARGDVKLIGYGKLREPALFMAAAARAVGTQSDGVNFGACRRGAGTEPVLCAVGLQLLPARPRASGNGERGTEFAIQNSARTSNGPMS